MTTTIDEIADGIHRISTFVPEIGPDGFTFNQFLLVADEPMLFHCGARSMFPAVAVAGRPCRRPHAMGADDVLDIGGKRIRLLSTPHVPHNWEAQVLFEETTGTLLCGDLLTHMGGRAPLTDGDVVEQALAADAVHGGTSLTPSTAPTIRGLADLAPSTLGLMHGSSCAGDGAAVLHRLADAYEEQLVAALR